VTDLMFQTEGGQLVILKRSVYKFLPADIQSGVEQAKRTGQGEPAVGWGVEAPDWL